jgi:hypothetical protein
VHNDRSDLAKVVGFPNVEPMRLARGRLSTRKPLSNRVHHERDHGRQLAQDPLGWDPQHGVAKAQQAAIPPRVRCAAAHVTAAVDFHH